MIPRGRNRGMIDFFGIKKLFCPIGGFWGWRIEWGSKQGARTRQARRRALRSEAMKQKTNQITNATCQSILNYLFSTVGAFPWRQNVAPTPLGGGRMKGATKKGVPDILCCYRGLWVGVEVKTGKDVQSDEQEGFQSSIEHQGGIYIIAASLEDFINQWQAIDWKEHVLILSRAFVWFCKNLLTLYLLLLLLSKLQLRNSWCSLCVAQYIIMRRIELSDFG